MSQTGKITHEGELDLNGIMLPCYVLEDGTRVLSSRGMQNSLKLVDVTTVSDTAKLTGAALTRFMGTKWFKSLIVNTNKLEHFKPIGCYKGNQRINGYEAVMLADFCDVMLDARNNGLIEKERQAVVAAQCEILIRAFAKVGIIALVDEATGYQYTREKNELQKILKAYVSEEILNWQKTFHDSFYREIFRLRKWNFTANDIKQRPSIVGKYTNQFVYEMLPPGVLQKLKQVTPKNANGNYIYKFHQSLTPETGREHLRNHLISVTTIMSIARNWQEFLDLFARKFGQTAIDFDDPVDGK
ncbi:P63C domain-containing protein [Spirosoma fluviale]|uniref:P63C domain-containing protein n=2 Tax=Spirosoma fluviale TaxID=1597977 RepID=A0A286GQ18_9BACT|nr:P63C domain-containing protein [Spirosoma fluviale]